APDPHPHGVALLESGDERRQVLFGKARIEGERPGALSGNLRFVLNRDDRQRAVVEGTLKGEKLDLSWLAGAPASLERLAPSADGSTLRIGEATLDWATQRFTLRGEAKRGANGPVLDATIDSEGVLVDALLPKQAAKPAPAK